MNRTKVFASDLHDMIDIIHRYHPAGGPVMRLIEDDNTDNYNLEHCRQEVEKSGDELWLKHIMLSVIEFVQNVPEDGRQYLLEGQDIIIFTE